MGNTDENQFINTLSKLPAKLKEKGSFYLTFKRNLDLTTKQRKKNRVTKRKVLEEVRQKDDANPEQGHGILCRLKTPDEKLSTIVKATRVAGFTNGLNGALRPHLFKNKVKKAIRRIRRPTPRDDKSKTSTKLRKRRQLIKQNRIKLRRAKQEKRKYKIIVRQGDKDKNRMEAQINRVD
eukprot:TRINITY_DN3031_c0_g1_i1.p1 TRINITY_DN3031_c0_g1~~TRINITY_DN3031_c0_g1_i1.p1  ORF type:complete len:179 (+),score=61.16 TRINITY_DN3031_c0_g1_i1:55-591(+)